MIYTWKNYYQSYQSGIEIEIAKKFGLTQTYQSYQSGIEIEYDRDIPETLHAINRTKVELKLQFQRERMLLLSKTINRTKVELKLLSE